jgi:hypothetical protein
VIRAAQPVDDGDAEPEPPILAPTPTAQLPRLTPPAMREPPDLRPHRPVPESAAVPVPPPVRRHNGPSAPPQPVAAAAGGVVLLVGGRATGRREGVQALERAGFTVLDAADGTGALQLLRAHGTVHVAVIAGETGAEPEDIARDLEALELGLRVVLVRGEGADEVPPPDLLDATVLREPVHPLALVQCVREARGRP